MDGIRAFIDTLKRDKARRRRLAGVVCVLAMFVAGGVFWRLRIIGLTKTVDPLCGVPEHIHTEACIAERILICGYPDEEVLPEPLPDAVQLPVLNPELQPEPLYGSCLSMIHQHDASCYDLENNLICGKADFVIHTHDSFCFDEYGTLVCPLNEVFEHIHGEECYTQSDITVCGLAEGEDVVVHIHGDECYSEDGTLICELPESEPHLHNELCYGRDLTCGLEEISEHIHFDECFDENGVRICEKTEILMHQHSDECRNTAGVDAPLPPVIDIDNPIDITNPVDPSIGELQPVIGVGDAVMQTGFDFMSISPVSDSINELENVEMGDVPAMPIEENSEPLPENAELDMPADPEVEDIATETENGEPLEDLPSENEPENGEAEGNLPSENETDLVVATPPETDFSAEAAEPVPHVHTDECYQIVYSCGLEEHTHTILCYADINADRDVAEEYRMRAESVELSGEYADDAVSIARSQLGYTESKQNFILDQNGVRKGYNLYSDWYTGGDGAYTDWNATFAAFCLEKAGIDREELLFNSGVHAWTVDLEKEWLLIRDTENAKFGAGDIIFFDTDGDGKADRVGICVTSSGDDGIFYTIEGDTPALGQPVLEENNILTELGFDGIAAFEDFAAEADSVFGEREIVNAEQSYVWDDDKIESHTVAEVMHSYSDGDVIGYVKLSAESEVEMYANYTNNYKELYTGDFTDLNEAIDGTVRDFVIVNTTNNEALAIEDHYELKGEKLEAKSNFQLQGTKWYFDDTWGSNFGIYTKDESGQKYYLVVNPSGAEVSVSEKRLFLQPANNANDASNSGAFNPNFALDIVDSNSFRIKCAWPDGSAYLKFENDSVILSADGTQFSLYDDYGNLKQIDNAYISHDGSNPPSQISNDCNNGASFYIAPTYNANNPLTMTATADGKGLQANWLSTDKNNIDTGELAYWYLECVVDGSNTFYRLYSEKNGTRYYVSLSDTLPALHEGNGNAWRSVILKPDDNNPYHLCHYWWADGFRTLIWENGLLTTRIYNGNIPNNVNFYNADGTVANPVFSGNNGEKYGPYAIRVGSEANPDWDNAFLAVDESKVLASKPFTPGETEVTPDMIWNFDFISADYDPKDYRIRTGDNSYLSIFEGTEGTEIRITANPVSSKFRLHNDENGVTAIESLNGGGGQFNPREFIALVDGKFVYKQYGDGYAPRVDTGGFKLYYIPDLLFDHIYQISVETIGTRSPTTENAIPVDIVLREGEVVRLDALSERYKNGNITIVSVPGGEDITSSQDVVECAYYRYEKSVDPTNPEHSEYILEALKAGKVQIQIKAENDEVIYVNVTVVPNNDNDAAYRDAVRETFQGYDYAETNRSKRYHHLDVEIEADFDINVYRPDGSVHKIEPDPGSIRVTKVYATVYNTASLLEGDAYAKWNESYLGNTGGGQTDAANGRSLAPYVDWLCEAYINPVPAIYNDHWCNEDGTRNYKKLDWLWLDQEKTIPNPVYMTNGEFDDAKIFKNYEFDYKTEYYSNEYFPEGGNVLSYTVNYNPGKTQENGQYEFLTNGWGWLELYDGDTAILHCTVEYEYNGVTYTVEKDVTRVICDTTNICPSGYSDSHPIQGFDVDVFFDDIDEFESTEFSKVDQYGDSIAGAEFAFYRDTGESYDISGKTPILREETDENGLFHFTYNDVVYATGLTDQEITDIIGSDRPGDSDYKDAPLTMSQLCKFLGEHFVMIETKIPDGYHKVGDQINMCFLGDTNVNSGVVQSSGNLFLVCDNTLDSGVYTDPNAFIEAPEKLIRADNSSTIQYINQNDFTASGRLYAVVAKRNGVNSGANDYRNMDYDHWDIVYGNDYDGYFYVGEGHGTEAKKGVAELLKMRASGELSENEGVYEFTQDQFEKNRYTVSAKNLPGDIKRFVNYIVENTDTLSQDDLDNLEYAILYYYLPNGAEPTADNLVRVTNIRNDSTGGTNFDINWSSTVKIPNIENRLFFQKRDSDGNLLNDAGFALYHSGDPTDDERNKVQALMNTGDDVEKAEYANIFTDAYYTDKQDGSVHYYLGDITNYVNGNAVGKAIIVKDGEAKKGEFILNSSYRSTDKERGYVIKPGAGQIRFVDGDGNAIGTISPATKPEINGVKRPYVGYTHAGSTENGELTDECSVVAEAGTGHFGRISNGKYILREIKPPSGFNVNNNAHTLVLVNDSGVFANAGKPYDSVSVANGAGYLVATLNSFASRGTIDESLRWIYTAMRVNDNTTFAGFAGQTGESEVKAPYKWPYAVPSGLTYYAPSGLTVPRDGWAKYPYLEDGTTVNDARTNNLSEALVTYLEYQTEYIDKDDNPNKDENKLEAPKALFDYETNNHLEKEAFNAFYGEYLNDALKKGKYPALEFKAGEKIKYTDKDGNSQEYEFTKDTILHGYEARKNFAGDKDTAEGSKTLRLFTDSGWSSLSVYQDFQWAQTYYAKQADADKNTSYRVLTSDAGPRELTHLYSNSTFVMVVDNVSLYLNVIKRGDTNGSGGIESSDSYLNGAEFVLYYEETDPDSGEVVRKYYTYDPDTKGVGVVEYEDGYTENDTLYPKAYRFTTGDNGAMQIRFARAGTYYLEEVNAPDPYGLIDTLRIDVILSDNPNDPNEFATITITDPDDPNNVLYTAQLVTNNNAYKEYYVEGATPAQYAIEILDPKNYRLEVEKIDKNGNTPLVGAQFKVYRLEDGKKVYYHEYTVKGITTTEDADDAQTFTTKYEKTTLKIGGKDVQVYVTNKDNIFMYVSNGTTKYYDQNGAELSDVPEGTTYARAYISIPGLVNEEVVYYIEEVKPPNGYNSLPGVIKVDFTRRTNDTDKLPTVTLDSGKTGDYIGEVTAIRGNVDDDGDGNVDPDVIVGYKFTVANESGFELPKTGSSGELIYTLFGMTLMIMPIVYIYVRRRRERRAAK